MKQISAAIDHTIARVIPRMSVLLVQSDKVSRSWSARLCCIGIYIMNWTKLPILWFRDLWAGLQLVLLKASLSRMPQQDRKSWLGKTK
jgi:hypothetical protein